MNFRKQIERNKKITFFVIIVYMMIMAVVGIMADMAVHPVPKVGFWNNVLLFSTFKETPYVTLIILGISIISVLVVHFFGHKMMFSGMEYDLIEKNETDLNKVMALNILHEMSISAGLRYTPKLYYINEAQANAFASGWGKSNACIGITKGLLDNLNRAELQSVIAHEVGHIIHGDSKLTMYVGILANITLTVTDIFAHLFYIFSAKDNSKEAAMARMVLLILNFILPLVTRILYLFLSRSREYMADAAAVKLTGDNQAMIRALLKIRNQNGSPHLDLEEEFSGMRAGEHYRRVAYIYSNLDSVFSTHPSIESRINALDPHFLQNEEMAKRKNKKQI